MRMERRKEERRERKEEKSVMSASCRKGYS